VVLFVISGIAVAVGLVCAFVRRPVFLLIFLCPLLGAGTMLSGVHFGTPARLIVAEALGSVAAPQITFIAISLAVFAFKQRFARSRELIPHAQAAIGRQLRTELELPHTLSPELAHLVSQLRFA
jgi:hypothetical protein